jgi:hypothetical protein
MVGSSTQAFADINHFNFILIAIAVGGIYLIPSVKSYLLAIISVCTATILLDAVLVFWANFSIPAFTLPFNIVSLTFVYVLGLIKYPQMAWIIKHTPEETLDLYLSNKRRYKGEERTIMLPFSGKWTVYQGFNGKWTHKGSWKYAYDFVITDEDGSTYKSDGFKPEDYFCYRKPVLSPVSGRVVKVIKNIPDNPIGEVNKIHNWGNLVIIKCESQYYVEISHFAEDSIKVEEGNWVERGNLLGHCGNSGYSPQPHIHVQVQETDTVGGYTIPFSFVNYLTGAKYSANDLPDEDTIVEPLYIENKYDSLTSFSLDEEYHYEVFNDGKKIDDLNLKVEMEIDGTFYFNSGKGKLYFGKHEGTFYFFSTEGNDPYLKLMFQALPRLPLSFRENLEWNDGIPIGQVTKGFIRGAVQFISSFKHNIFSTEINLKFNSTKEVSGKIFSRMPRIERESLVELDDSNGFNRIKVDNIELKRIVK